MSLQAILYILGPLLGSLMPPEQEFDTAIGSNPAMGHGGLTKNGFSVTAIPQLLITLLIKNQELIKLFLIGIIIEMSRRCWHYLSGQVKSTWCTVVEFDSNDEAYSWMMVWISLQPAIASANWVHVSTKGYNYGLDFRLRRNNIDDSSVSRKMPKISLLPAFCSEFWFKYKGVWIAIVREKEDSKDYLSYQPRETLTLRMYTRHKITFLKTILADARAAYGADREDYINIYGITADKDWFRTSVRKKRPLNTIILDPRIKNLLLHDINDFLISQKWYADRGIPYRRGYLLYGVPGSGKTSLIHAIAGEFGMNVYVISLSKKGFDDTDMHYLFSMIPPRCIVLIEDIDAAFRSSPAKRTGVAGHTQSGTSSATPGQQASDNDNSKEVEKMNSGGITLSGLLNTLDGIAAQEGSIYFATTNRFEALDKALYRPGRLDVHIEFKNASYWQCKELFKAFYPPSLSEEMHDDDIVLDYKKFIEESGELVTTTLTEEEIEVLAEKFADRIPDGKYAMANIQGHFLKFKDRPWDAVSKVNEWLDEEEKLRDARLEFKPGTPPDTLEHDEEIATTRQEHL